MAVFLSDDEIEALIAEPKLVDAGFRSRLSPKAKRGHAEADLDVTGSSGAQFRVIVRRSKANPIDFSVILGYRVPESNQVFRLRRYNGKSHEHTNPIEGQQFYGFHIHTATDRYQRTGNREDTFAELTDRYEDLEGAINCLTADCSIVLPPESQMALFE